MYETAGDLWAMPFSVSDLKRTGEPFPINVVHLFQALRAMALVYLGTTGGQEQLIWRDRKGVKLGPVGQPQAEFERRACRPMPVASRLKDRTATPATGHLDTRCDARIENAAHVASGERV